jgi:pyruvate dehydrogenase E2 component (dihydrolipoamide acetyltransferase)
MRAWFDSFVADQGLQEPQGEKMATTLSMPKLGLTMTEGIVVKWLRQDGDQVEQGQPIVVVMSKKITYEVEAPASGILRMVAQPKESRRVTEVIGFILEPGEPMPKVEMATTASPTAKDDAIPTAETPAPAPAREEPPREVRSSPAARRLARELGVDITRIQGSGRDGRITEKDVQAFHDGQARTEATPLARRMAEEEDLDLASVSGTGPDGRITEDDVLRVLDGRLTPGAVLPREVPFVGMRQAIAETMMDSLHSMAQLTLTSHADVTALAGLRDVLRRRWEAHISYTDLIVKAVALALGEHPILNSTLTGEEIVLHNEINIGVAVALAQGLIVPVVRDVDEKSVLEIHRALCGLAERARGDQLSVDEVTGGTFTVTNLGLYRVDAFTPIVNPPEVAILGVGQINEHLVLTEGQVSVRFRMALSLTIDHRVVDGAPGAAFLQTLVEFLEEPALIFAEGPVLTPSGRVEGKT